MGAKSLTFLQALKQARKMEKPNSLFSFCSLLMAIIFAYSASVQLNDPDWYFWFPLYSIAWVVNLANPSSISGNGTVMPAAKSALVLGTFLFLKVVAEDLVSQVAAGFWSLDPSKRVVREKIGSLLVIISMALHLMQSSDQTSLRPSKKNTTQRLVEYGTCTRSVCSFSK